MVKRGTGRVFHRMFAVLLSVCMMVSCVAAAAWASTAGDKVNAEHFSFSITDASGTTHDFTTIAELQADGYSLSGDAGWDGVFAGEQPAGNYPSVQGYEFKGLTLDDMAVYEIGLTEVNSREYVYVTVRENGETDSMTSIVLPEGETIHVNYRPQEYPIDYGVYIDGEKQEANDAKFGLDAIFGLNRAGTTSRQSFSVNVTIPAGYTGRVYLGDTSAFSESDNEKLEHFPLEPGYGNYPLGEDVEWEKTDYGAKIKESCK